MKFRIISDIHLDFSMYDFPILETDNETTLLVAGDIGTGDRLFRTIEWLNSLAERFQYVIFVLGNHDYWGNSIDGAIYDVKSYLRTFGNPNLFFLENEYVDLGELIIYGGTMWTNVPPYADIYEKNMGDWHYTTNEKGYRFGADNQREIHEKFKEGLKEVLKKERPVVVMSHHAPFCTREHNPHGNNLDVYYYSSDIIDLLNENVLLWVHGHTHDFVDTMCMNTRVVCNPRGYESKNNRERTGFKPKLIVEVVSNEN